MTVRRFKPDANATLLSAANDLDEAADWWQTRYILNAHIKARPGSPIDIRIKRYRARAVKLRGIAGQ